MGPLLTSGWFSRVSITFSRRQHGALELLHVYAGASTISSSGAGGRAAESALQNRPSWDSDIHLEHSWRARARWERWERGIVRDEQFRSVAESCPKCDVAGFVQGIARGENLNMTRRVDTDDLVYGVRGHVQVVSGVHGHSVTAPKLPVRTPENVPRAATALRVHPNAHDFAKTCVPHQPVPVPPKP